MSPSGPGSGLNPAHSPSFNDYSSSETTATATRVVTEFPPDDNNDVVFFSQNDAVEFDTKPENSEEGEDDDDSSFEFPVPGRGDDDGDEIFADGQIRPQFPLFNTDLVFADTDWRDEFEFEFRNRSEEENRDLKSADSASIRMPLKKLMISERETSVTAESASCSSSEADELDGVAPESYCVWNPAKEEMRKKSKSTGSSKRWRIRDLLYRSNSDGGDGFVRLSAKQQQNQSRRKSQATAPEKRSYSPYKQDPVGFFSRMNGLSRTIQPF